MFKYALMLGCMCTSLLQASMVDPTKPGDYTGPGSKYGYSIYETEEIKLQSILISKNRKVAILNGNAYMTGEAIGQYRIISIQPDGVFLFGHSAPFFLRFHNESMKSKQVADPSIGKVVDNEKAS